MYPQYSGTTTASVIDAVASWSLKVRHLPELRFVNRYHDDAGYIEALTRKIRAWSSRRRGWARRVRPPGRGRRVPGAPGVRRRWPSQLDPYTGDAYSLRPSRSSSLPNTPTAGPGRGGAGPLGCSWRAAADNEPVATTSANTGSPNTGQHAGSREK